MSAIAALSADALAYRVQMLERIRTDLAALHADAETHRLPQSVTMGLHWLCEDAASTLADMHKLTAPQAAP